MNSVILIGRLARDPELSYTPNNQTAVAHFTLAVDRQVSQGGERQADFIRITVFGKQAETCDRYLQKGRQVAVNGRIQTGSYKNRDGATVYTTDVIANRVEFLGSGQSGQSGQSQTQFNGQSQSFGNEQFGGNAAPDFGGFGGADFPDSFQAAEDDIPF